MKASMFCQAGILALSLVSATLFPAIAQRPGVETDFASLFSRDCVDTGRGSLDEPDNRTITIGRGLETSIARINPGSNEDPFLLVCKINNRGSNAPFGTLRLAFGHADSSEEVSNISFYLDGNFVGSYTLREGELKSVLIDVSETENLAIEVSSSEYRQFDRQDLYIFDATLEPLY